MSDIDASTPQAVDGDLPLSRLVQAVAESRDRSAFASLFAYFAPRIKAYLMRGGADAATAEEIVQEVMIAIWRRAETFDAAQATVSTWVFTIARNKRIDLLRRERRAEVDPDDPALVPAPEELADVRIAAGQDAGRLQAAMRGLPEEQHELLRMAYFDDKPHSAIAEASGLPLGTVKSRIRLALARLRKEMKVEH
ncbi:MAG: sigma-70 family RNA polymerase sigma factor [Rhodospirillaceae bacterium]|nr:sigma-70 family RNA polymerase sigma factor [Rhodospirillaceae bacterium]